MIMLNELVEFDEIVEVQDNAREAELRKLLGLEKDGNRQGIDAKFPEDHTKKVELKSTTKATFTTSSHLNHSHLEKWRTCHWVFGVGINYKKGFKYTEIYYIPPIKMPVIFAKIKYDLDQLKKIADKIESIYKSEGEEEQEYFKKFIKRGKSINCPPIPVSDIREHGIKLVEPYDVSLRDSVDDTIPSTECIEESLLDKFFI